MNGRRWGVRISIPCFYAVGSRLQRKELANSAGFEYGDFIMARSIFIFYGFLNHSGLPSYVM